MFFQRDKDIVVLEIGTFKTLIGTADYTLIPQKSIITTSTHKALKAYGIDVARNTLPLLLIENSNWSVKTLESIIQELFEKANIPGLFLLPSALACLYACSYTTGLVVDIGYKTSFVTPVIDNQVLFSCRVKIDVGAADVDTLFNEKKEDVRSAEYLDKKKNMSADHPALQVLFEPKLVGKHCMGIHEAVLFSVEKVETTRRLMLWETIVFTGGLSSITGLRDR